MKLNDLLNSLEKQAGFPFQEKDKEDDKEKSKEDKKDEKKDDGDKSNAKEEKKDEKEQEKSAAFKSGEQLAKEIMEKVASTKIEKTKGEEMNKQASDAGKALAQALLEKLAGVGDQNTDNGIPAGVVPNKTQVDIAQQKAEHDNIFQATPGTDGAGNGGTINQIFDAIVADAAARGAVLEASTAPQAAAEGAVSARQAPAQVPTQGPGAIGDDSQEKTAAVVALVNSGLDFDEAVNLVKQASDELEAEHVTHVKQAALNELMDSGVDFDLAVALVQQLG